MIATPLYRQTLAQAILAAVTNYKRAVGNPALAVPRGAPRTEDDNSADAPTVSTTDAPTVTGNGRVAA